MSAPSSASTETTEIETTQAAEAADVSGSVGPDALSLGMLHCLFAMVFAATALTILSSVGFVVRSGIYCPADDGYGRCEMWQDARSLLSFVLGALVCCLVERELMAPSVPINQVAPVRSDATVQLYACLL